MAPGLRLGVWASDSGSAERISRHLKVASGRVPFPSTSNLTNSATTTKSESWNCSENVCGGARQNGQARELANPQAQIRRVNATRRGDIGRNPFHAGDDRQHRSPKTGQLCLNLRRVYAEHCEKSPIPGIKPEKSFAFSQAHGQTDSFVEGFAKFSEIGAKFAKS